MHHGNSHVLPVQCDVTSRESVRNAVETVRQRFGPVQVLINCAGLMYFTRMSKLMLDDWQRQIDVNCSGTVNCIGAVLPDMLERKCGHVVNITSDAGIGIRHQIS